MNAQTTTESEAVHYWFGRWVTDTQLSEAIDTELATQISQTLAQSFPFEALMVACQSLSHDLKTRSASYTLLQHYMQNWLAADELEGVLTQLSQILEPNYLQTKLRKELGTTAPNILERSYPESYYEMWAPMGCLVHVMPSNVFVVAALGLLEGLLANNVNVVKLSARDTSFAALFAQELVRHDSSQRLQQYVAVLRLSSQQDTVLKRLFKQADAVSAWGGETAIAAIRAQVPAHVRVITWGHKVSFGYISQSYHDDEATLLAFALDVCRLDQQACSSPQTLFVETESPEQLVALGQRLARALAQVSPTVPADSPDRAAQAEITTVLSVAKAEQAMGLCHVIESPSHDWRVIIDFRTSLKPSPLYRTIWLVPMQRHDLTAVLRPMRAWLQTCGLAAGYPEAAELSRLLLAAGVTRITRPGQMVDSYNGAPHDGVYALQQFMRRISVELDPSFAQVGSLAQLRVQQPTLTAQQTQASIMSKYDFQQLANQDDPEAGLIVRSGGSSGMVAYSSFRWPDYARQMQATGHGLVAAGLDPKKDVVMNLFAAGYMYGSFISFWTILEQMQVRQLPMTMVSDYELIANEIIRHKVTTLVGMTPHLLGLFTHQGARLHAYGGLEKIFYGGEGLSAAQYDFLHKEQGIALVKSAAYGSNDAGPMGYQCEHSQGGVHHLMSSLQHLEIVKLDKDEPVEGTQVGRLLFTSKARSFPTVTRYEIGDLGRWVTTPCACGRTDQRFELMGRLGDVFKAGSPLLNYQTFARLLSEGFQYAGRLQIHLDSEGAYTVLRLWVDHSLQAKPEEVLDYLFEQYLDLQAIQTLNLAVRVLLEPRTEEEFVRVQASGKIPHVCDHRVNRASEEML